MTKLFSRWLPCATLATWSTILLYFSFSGRMSALLTPGFRTGALVAGIVLGLMSIVFLITSADAQCCAAAECGHPLSRLASGKVLTFLILLMPISVAAMFSPDAFGKSAIENRGIAIDPSQFNFAATKYGGLKPMDDALPTNTPPSETPAPAEQAAAAAPADYLQRTPAGHIVTEVLDLLYAAQDSTLRKDFEGKSVELIGQIMPDKSSAGTAPRFKAVRMFMTCCAADARPVATLVECEKLPDFPEMTWVKITGTATFPIENGRRTALLVAKTIEKGEPPEEMMLY